MLNPSIRRVTKMNARITDVSIKTPDGVIWSLPEPNRHGDVIELIFNTVNNGKMVIGEQGFLINNQYFVNRQEALTIAIFNEQLIAKHPQPYELYSEDIW